MTNQVAIVAAAALPVGRYMPGVGASAGIPEADRLLPVVRTALRQAGIEPSDIDTAVFAANPPTTRQKGFAAYMASRLGLRCSNQMSEVSAMGITGGLAIDIAAAEIMLGRSRFALALGLCYQAAEKPYVSMERGINVVGDVDFQAPFGITPIAWYAFDMARYQYETGATREQIASVAIKSRQYAQYNPLAQYREPISMSEILEADMIVDPLGRWEVPSQADGAVCLVLCNRDDAAALKVPHAIISGRGFCHDGLHQMGDVPGDLTDFSAARNAVDSALESTSLAHDNIDLYELYAPCTITEVLVSEAIGLFDSGKGATAAAEGRTGPGGTIPINTSGGCLARGHPPSLTGLYGALECFEQVTDAAGARQVEGASVTINLCEGGNYNLALAHVIERA